MRIVGIMPVYNEIDWIESAIEGIIDFVDELVIAEGYMGPSWHFGSCRSTDGTIESVNKAAEKYDKITLVQSSPGRHVLKGRAATYNHALQKSKLLPHADWIMICDADEFYTEQQKSELRRLLLSTSRDAIAVSAYMFFFGFENYLRQTLVRFFRVTPGMYFRPGQYPFYSDGRPYYDDINNPPLMTLAQDPMFHYSFVKRTSSEIRRRIMEYCAAQRDRRIFDWIDEVYLAWRPENAEDIYSLNRRRFGGTGILFVTNNGSEILERYSGPHPAITDSHPFRHVRDVRSVESKSGPASRQIRFRHHVAHYGIRILQWISGIYRSLKSARIPCQT